MNAFVKRAACCVLGLMVVGTLRAESSDFKTEILASSSPAGFTLNAYPVIARLATGRLLCVFSVANTGRPTKIKIASSASIKIASSASDDNGKTWSAPAVVFDHPHAQDEDPSLLVDGDRVLAFSTTVPDPANISRSLIYMRASIDGIHWEDEVLLKTPHRYIAGKIHQGHRLPDGTLVIGYAWDTWAEQNMPPATEGEMNIKSGVLRSLDAGKTWSAGGDMYADIPKTSPHATSGLDEPATVVLADGRLMALMRTSGTRLYQAWSKDGGITWSTPQPSTLTAHNSPAALWRLDGLHDIVAVWNNSSTGRTLLTAALSSDGGRTWSRPRVLATAEDAGEVSYPSVVQAKDGTIVAVWQCKLPQGGREIHMAHFTRAELISK